MGCQCLARSCRRDAGVAAFIIGLRRCLRGLSVDGDAGWNAILVMFFNQLASDRWSNRLLGVKPFAFLASLDASRALPSLAGIADHAGDLKSTTHASVARVLFTNSSAPGDRNRQFGIKLLVFALAPQSPGLPEASTSTSINMHRRTRSAFHFDPADRDGRLGGSGTYWGPCLARCLRPSLTSSTTKMPN